MPQARRTLSLWDFFNLGFGAIVGSSWLLLVGDWMVQGGGPTAVVVASLLGMILMAPIACVFAELATARPKSGGVLEFVERTHGRRMSSLVGWAMILGSGVVAMWDSLVLSVIISQVLGGMPAFAWLNAVRLYRVAGTDIYLLPALLADLVVLYVGHLNLDRPQDSARLQLVLSYVQLAGMLVVLGVAALRGSPDNALPAFASLSGASVSGADPPASLGMGVMSMLCVTPFFYAGFSTIPQRSEEAAEGVNWNKFGKVIAMTLVASAGFYIIDTYAFGTMVPWTEFVARPLTAIRTLGELAPRVMPLMLVVALLCPIGPMNSFVGATGYSLLALARMGQLSQGLAQVDPLTGVPRDAIRQAVGVALVGPFLGAGVLAPLSKVSAFAFCFAYLVVSLSCLRMRKLDPTMPRPFHVLGGRMGVLAACVASGICMALLAVPLTPSSFSAAEWAIVLAWALLWLVISLDGDGRRSRA